MKISASGVLLRAAERLKHTRDARHLEYTLRQLYSHLKELQQRHAAGDATAIVEFFEIWTGFEAESGIES